MSNEITATPTITPATEVRIWVTHDDDATRVSAVLEALGYCVLRELEQGEGPSRLRWAVNRLSQRHQLTTREQEILERVLAGRKSVEISRDLEISPATVKWHMHNIFAKTNTNNRESLLRLALQLGGRRADEAKDDDDTPTVLEADVKTEPHAGAKLESREAIPAAAVPSKSWF